jgi:Domain of unknown function (DUF4185)
MGASAYVGRVGGLAVALGVGAAVATGHGVAWADGTGPSASTSDHSVSEGSPNAADSSSSDSSTSSPASTSDTAASNTATSGGEGMSGTTGTAGTGHDTGDDGGTAQQGESGAATDIDGADGADGAGNDVDNHDAQTTDESHPSAGPPDTGAESGGDAHDTTPGRHNRAPTHNSESTTSSLPSTVGAASGATTDDKTDDKTVNDTAGNSFRMATLSVDQPAGHVQMFSTAVQDTAPLSLTTTQPAAEEPSLQRMVVNVLSSLSAGLSALASDLPGAPVWSPFVMAVLGLGSRREFSEPMTALVRSVATVPVAALTVTDMATAVVFPGTTRKPTTVSTNTQWIDYVTGAGNLNNTTARFGIGGADLGIMWDNGIPDNPATTTIDEHQVLIAFGDTFSQAPRSGVWRFNTLFRSPDDNLANGLYVPNGVPVSHLVTTPNPAWFSGSPMERANWADPILPSPGDPPHPPYAVGPEVTIIPTAGVSTPYNNAYGARQYMSFMSVRSWDTSGRWTTNYSGVAYSDDNGQSWTIAPTSIRTAAAGRATVPYVSGNQNFQQGAFVTPPEGSADAAQGWVYSYGTPSGRAGTLYLSRVNENQILDVSKYQYWNGTGWVGNSPSAAAPILPATTTNFFGFKTTKYPAVSELSVQYNPYLKKYVMLYGDSSNRIVMRTSDSPQGTWSTPKTLVGAYTLGGKYAPYIHPWSGTDELTDSGQYLYWNLSTWGNYQVRLMRTDLTKV